MNKQRLFVLAALAISSSAVLADDATVVKDSFVAERTRAEVRADVLEAREAGVLRFTTERHANVTAVMPTTRSTLTRQQVQAGVNGQQRQRNASFYETT